jgi:tetratricopeptide (TPR) repeat protein
VRAGAGDDLDRAELERARTHFRRAAELDPGLAAAWVELGESYDLDGLEEESPDPGIDALERAFALLPADTRVHLALGRLLTRAGDPDAARLHLQLVLRWSWSEREREQAEEALADLGG